MTADPLRKQIAREVKRALSDADVRAPEAARRMKELTGKPAEPKTIYRWARGEVLAPLDRLAEFAAAIGQPITLRLGPQTQESPPPEWAEGLVRIEDVARVIDVLSKSGALNETVERLLDLVSAALVPPPDVAQAPRTPATPPEAGPS